jgi:hypothetical protein
MSARAPEELQSSMELTPTSTFVALNDQVSTPLNRETVLLHLKTGKYYSLNRVGTVVWEQIRTPQTLDQVVDALLEKFAVERTRCEADVRRILLELTRAGFVEIR